MKKPITERILIAIVFGFLLCCLPIYRVISKFKKPKRKMPPWLKAAKRKQPEDADRDAGVDFDELSKRLESALENTSDEEFRQMFPEDTTPKGWVDIEEHLPQLIVGDFVDKGYSEYKVKDKDGNVFDTKVTDSLVWYYRAKECGVTHWLNT